MKIKTNLRAGKQSGTVASGNKGGGSDNPIPETEVVEVYAPVVSTTRCAGL